MGKNRRKQIPKRNIARSNYYLLLHEQKELESHYDFLSCTLKNNKGKRELVVRGIYNQTGIEYVYEIIYNGFQAPNVRIISPDLIPNPPHIYEDGSLCLYYPKEQPWISGRNNLYSHIIPWVHEWILYYEIYLINGKWEHPEVIHQAKK